MSEIFTVFAAEFMRRVRSRVFVIGLLVGIVAIIGFAKLPAFVGAAFGGATNIIVVGDKELTDRAVPLLKNDYEIKAVVPPGPVDQRMLKDNDASAAFVITRNANGLTVVVYAHDPGSMGPRSIRRDLLPLQLALATKSDQARVKTFTDFPVDVKTVASRFENSDQALAARGIAYTLIFFLYMLILVNSQLITSSVAEEKTSRIAELLVASVDPAALLGGKVLAGASLALIQLIVWVGAGVLFGTKGGSSGAADADTIFSLAGLLNVITPGVLVAFVVFFVIGFLQLSTVFAGFASLINRTEDLGSITGPLVLPVVAALFIAIGALGNPDTPWAVGTSMLPLLAPFVMFARIAVSNVPIWQIALSLAINLAALYGIALVAGKVYRVGMLLYGRTPNLRQVWAVIVG